ncbi:DUF2637 domain-containing protein [Streptomyces sp. NPDC048639]|uniref:DUF2637 domain-containing protein n=1 Tax=Streptomyces sp. NPDC048639 TaxID=3365581 RepID=UPI003716A9F9
MAAPNAMKLTRTHRILVGVVVAGALVIAGIGFAGSYAAVRDLAERKGFGAFAVVFPIGIDAGIVVLLALDLLLTWIRIPFPLLRQTAWLLTAATIAFNGAAAWPDPLGVGMHAVIPILFVVAVEAARHAIGRIADITADRHMESVRIARWLLAFPSTFRLWRRMKLWELRSYDEVIRLEQDRLVYQARLRARYGRAWRRKAPVESLMPLKLARYGIPLAETGPAGLAAAGIDPPVVTAGRAAPGDRSSGLASGTAERRSLAAGDPAAAAPGLDGSAGAGSGSGTEAETYARAAYGSAYAGEIPAGTAYGRDGAWPTAAEAQPQDRTGPQQSQLPQPQQWQEPQSQSQSAQQGRPQQPQPQPEQQPPADQPQPAASPAASPAAEAEPSHVTVPVGPGRYRSLGQAQAPGNSPFVPSPRTNGIDPQEQLFVEPAPAPAPARTADDYPAPEAGDDPVGLPDGVPREEVYFEAYRGFIAEQGSRPTARQLSRALNDRFGVTNSDGSLLSESYLRAYMREFRDRYNAEMGMAG